jgi:hypothetical protein
MYCYLCIYTWVSYIEFYEQCLSICPFPERATYTAYFIPLFHYKKVIIVMKSEASPLVSPKFVQNLFVLKK